MSDPRHTFHLPVEGDPPVRFTNTAIALAERHIGKTTPQIAAHLMAGVYGIDTLNRLALAGLEGARRKNKTGGKEWKLEQVEQLLEDAVEDGRSFDEIAAPLIDAWTAALNRWFPEEEEPAEDPQTAAGSGTTSSEPPSEQG